MARENDPISSVLSSFWRSYIDRIHVGIVLASVDVVVAIEAERVLFPDDQRLIAPLRPLVFFFARSAGKQLQALAGSHVVVRACC